MASAALLVMCSCPTPAVGEKLALSVVEERLAACVSVLPDMTSIYRWKGETHTENECLLLIKSTTAGFAALRERLSELHPYELPEIIGVPISESDSRYLHWLVENVKNP